MQTSATRKTSPGDALSRPAAPQRPRLTPDEIAARDHARHELDRGLRLHGIATTPHFDVSLGEERALYVKVAFDTAIRDRTVVVGMLEHLGWIPDPERLSRASFAIETLRVRHKPSGARLTVIVRIPTGESMRREVVE